MQCPRWGGGCQQGQFAPAPQGKGAPKQCCTCSNKICSSVIFESSFFEGLVSLYFRLKLVCSFALRFMLLTQIMHSCHTWPLRSPLATAPYVALFDLKPLIEDGNLQVYICTVCRYEEEPQEPPEYTSEGVKSQIFLGACPHTPLT